jgi:hypothetical protein
VKTLLFAAGLVAACALNAADFRNATWGMSPEQVIKSEKIKLKKDFTGSKGSLNSKCKLLGYPAKLAFMFEANRLFRTYYSVYFPISTDLPKSQKVFYTFKKMLSKKYGTSSKPSLQLCYFSDKKGKLSIDDLKAGDAKLTCKWKKSGTNIELKLWRINSKYDNGKWLKAYGVMIIYEVANKKQVFAQWKQEDAKKAVSQTEAQL